MPNSLGWQQKEKCQDCHDSYMKLIKAPVHVDTKELILVDQKLYFPQVDALHITLHSWFGLQEGFYVNWCLSVYLPVLAVPCNGNMMVTVDIQKKLVHILFLLFIS